MSELKEAAHPLRGYVERMFQKWLTEQPLDTIVDSTVAVNTALQEIFADGITTVEQMKGFDLEGIWER